MKYLTDIVSYDTAVLLKKLGFNLGTMFYYHTHYAHRIWNEDSLEMTGDGNYTFYNSDNRYRCAAPFYWQLLLWGIFHPFKSIKVWRMIIKD